MARRKRYIRGKIYITNDKLFSKDKFAKSGRRVVAVNNDKNALHVVKIMGLYDKNGNLRKALIPIEHYEGFTKPSGIHPFVFTRTRWGAPIKENKLKKTNIRLNKWDLKKLK